MVVSGGCDVFHFCVFVFCVLCFLCFLCIMCCVYVSVNVFQAIYV